MSDPVRPIFLFSLPRAGSTLAQRVLASHEDVATAPEPWLLLPHLYATRESGVYAEYAHTGSSVAIQDFSRGLPGGTDSYLAELRRFALRLYGRAAGEARYFLDKTPRYHLISDEIIRLFPDGKFIFLWRNPLAVVASNVETWAGGKWRLYGQKIDFFEGLTRLVAAYEAHEENVCALRYEDLVLNPEREWRRVFDYLELRFDPDLLTQFTGVSLEGRMGGDPTGKERYRSIDAEPLEKWKKTLSNPLRKAWCRRYLGWIGRDRLATMGYELDVLLDELAAVPDTPEMLLSDAVRLAYGAAYPWLEPGLLKDKLRLLPHLSRVYPHR